MRRRAILGQLAALLAVVAMAAGCGDSGGPTSAASTPEPDDYVGFATYVAQLVAEGNGEACDELAQINRRSPEGIPCPPPEPLRKRMDSFEIGAAIPYDDVGLIYYTRGGTSQLAAMILFGDSRRRWSVQRLEIGATPMADPSSAQGAATPNAAIDSYLRAVRMEDCEALDQIVFRPAPNDPRRTYHAPGTEPAGCDGDGQLAKPEELAHELQASPSQTPTPIRAGNGDGEGDGNFAFYSLTTADDKRYVFTVMGALVGRGGPYLVLDFFEDRSAPSADDTHASEPV